MNITNDNQNTKTAALKTTSGRQPWYTKTGWIITLLVFFFPVGLYLMWKYCKWRKKTKGIVTAVVLVFALLCTGNNKEPDSSGNRNLPTASQTSHEESTSATDLVVIEEIESTEETSTPTKTTKEEETSLPETTEPETTVKETVTEVSTFSPQEDPARAIVTDLAPEANVNSAPNPETQPSIAPTEAVAPSTAAPIAAGTQYVVNTNTGKFHYPSCRHVDDIKDKNRWDYIGTRDELISMGYNPCKACTP